MTASLQQDLRHVVRGLRRSPMFVMLAVLILALGIGSSTAVYTAVDAVLLRALPYPGGDRLVALWADGRARDMPQREWTNPADFTDWQRGLSSIDGMAAWTGWMPTLTGYGDPLELPALQVSRDYFGVLGVPLFMGRGFSAEEDAPNGPEVVVVSHGFWRERLGAPAVLGQPLELNGVVHTVIGVTAPGFVSPMTADRQLWRPLRASPESGRGSAYLRVIGRLADGHSLAGAQQEFSALQRRLGEQYPATNGGFDGYLQPLRATLGEGLREQLLVLQAGTLLLLLMACANLASLLLARASVRAREYALRASLGASRGRIARQLLLESGLLGVAGAGLGLLLAQAGAQLMAAALPAEVTQLNPLQVDLRVVAVAAALALGCGLLFGTAPALMAARQDLNAVLQRGERAGTGPAGLRARGALVALTFALALALCVGAGLFLRSLHTLQGVDPGFSAARALSLRLLLPSTRYVDADDLRRAHAALTERLASVPGVEAVGLTSMLPLGEGNSDTRVRLDSDPPEGDGRRLWYSQIDPGYFAAMQTPLREGRGIARSDHADAPLAVVVNQAFVRDYLAGAAALGRRLNFGSVGEPRWGEIVGVAKDVRFFGLAEAQTPSAYLALEQFPARSLYLVVRSSGEPEALLPALRAALAEVDPQLAVTPMTMESRLQRSLATPRLVAVLGGGFAALAALLAAVGVYGVIAFVVHSQIREFGVRLALGAQASQLLGHVLGLGLRLALPGVALGIVLSLLLGRSMEHLLYGVGSNDPMVLAAGVLLLGGVALAASLLPGLQASRLAPIQALRQGA